MSGLFSIFNTAKSGMFTQQKALGVTNHNIANANTEGYSRQRAEIVTNRPFMNPSMNSYLGPGQIGTGSQVSTIRRVRDEFLDYQIRQETSTYGKYDVRQNALTEIELIYNEPSDNGVSALIDKFFDSWQQLSKQPESSNAKTVVKEQAAALAKELNHISKQLGDLKENTNAQIQESIFRTNNLLNQIDDLNQQILSVKVTGQEPNDLMDKRDLLIDELSEVMGVEVDKKDFYALDIKPDDIGSLPPGCESLLVRKDPNYAVSRFSYVSNIEVNGDKVTLTYMKNGNPSDTSTMELDLSGPPPVSPEEKAEIIQNLEENRMIWAKEDGTSYIDGKSVKISGVEDLQGAVGLFKPESGSMSGLMSIQEDVNKYMDKMDDLAKGLAMSVNAVHSQSADGSTGVNIFVNGNGGTEAEITAANIAINSIIDEDPMKIIASASGENNTDGRRALAIAQLRDTLMEFQHIDSKTTRKEFLEDYTGGLKDEGELGDGLLTIADKKGGMTTNSYFKDIIDELGIQTQEAKRIVQNQGVLLAGFEDAKESVSGVSLDEEMSNLIMFQHAYGASAKVIATVDEMLEVVINGLVR